MLLKKIPEGLVRQFLEGHHAIPRKLIEGGVILRLKFDNLTLHRASRYGLCVEVPERSEATEEIGKKTIRSLDTRSGNCAAYTTHARQQHRASFFALSD